MELQNYTNDPVWDGGKTGLLFFVEADKVYRLMVNADPNHPITWQPFSAFRLADVVKTNLN